MQIILKLCAILMLVSAEISSEIKSEAPIRKPSAETITNPHSDLLLKLQQFLETHKDTENHLNEIRSKPTPPEPVEATTETSTFNSKLKQAYKENIERNTQIEKQYKMKEDIDKVNYTENKMKKIPKQLLNTNNNASFIKKDTAMPIDTNNNTHVFIMHFGKISPNSTAPGSNHRSTNQTNYLRTQNENNINIHENIVHDTGNTSLAINIENDDGESSDSDSDSEEEEAETTTVATHHQPDDKHLEVKKNTYYVTKTTTRLIFVNPIKEVMNKYLRVFKRRQELIRRRKRLSEDELLFH